jgi:signal transduction histidine kinase
VRVWRDWVLVAAVVAAAVIEAVLRDDLPQPVFSAALAAGLAPALLWRRTRPLLVVAVVMGVISVAWLLPGEPPEQNAMAFVLLFPYALTRWGAGREMAIGLAIFFGHLAYTTFAQETTLGDSIGGVAVISASAALGGALRYRARARTRELDQVKLLEREQLARDLHDIVAHHVSAMAIRAQAGLATAATEPTAATDALRVIEAEASRALAEMRAMVRVLRRDEPADLAPGHRIADLKLLESRSVPAVDVEISGDLEGLSPSVEAAVYRLAQESVTNARRHARHASRIEVRVTEDATSVRLRVHDDGEGSNPGIPGYGLIGMKERADLLGGACAAGPDPGGGWTVTAELPRTGTGTGSP